MKYQEESTANEMQNTSKKKKSMLDLRNQISVTREGAAELNSTSVKTIDGWIQRGLPAYKEGVKTLINVELLNEWTRNLAKNRIGFSEAPARRRIF